MDKDFIEKQKEIIDGLNLNLANIKEEGIIVNGVLNQIQKAKNTNQLEKIVKKDLKRRAAIMKELKRTTQNEIQ